LLKRSDKVQHYQGKWNSVSGYIDEPKPFVEKVTEELFEEIGLDHAYIDTFTSGIPHKIDDDQLGKTWIVVPARVELAEKVALKLNWEHSEYTWISMAELEKYDTVPGLLVSIEAVK
jgi:8-oxo-dGTP pyrophosphatase MutT (NUDIX family)